MKTLARPGPGFRLVKRQIRPLEQFIRIHCTVRYGDADTGADFDLLLTQLIGAADLIDELGGKTARGVLIQIVGDNRELIASKAANHVIIAADGREALRHGLKQRIACIVAERVVDILEPVEIEQQYGCRTGATEGPAQPLDQFLPEQRPIWQARQRIMIGIMLQTDIFCLQLQRRGAQIVRQPAHAFLRAVQEIVLAKQQYDKRDAAEDETASQRRIDDVELADILMGGIDQIHIIRDGRRRERRHRRIQRAHSGKKIRHIARIQAVYLLFETRQNGVKAGYQIPPLLLFIDESAEVALL